MGGCGLHRPHSPKTNEGSDTFGRAKGGARAPGFTELRNHGAQMLMLLGLDDAAELGVLLRRGTDA